jgi:acyl carrier protein
LTVDTKAAVRAFIVESFLMGRAGELRDDTSLTGRGILDSTSVIELVTFIEKTFAVRVEEDELVPENLDSLDAIAAFVARKGAPAPAKA